jgi:hypothetical protein
MQGLDKCYIKVSKVKQKKNVPKARNAPGSRAPSVVVVYYDDDGGVGCTRNLVDCE